MAERNEPDPRGFYKTAAIGLCCFDLELRFLDVNDWLAGLSGRSVEDHLGRTAGDIWPDIAPGVEASLRHVMASSEPVLDKRFTRENSSRYRNGKSTYNHSYAPVRAEDGSIAGVSAVIEDITDRLHPAPGPPPQETWMHTLLEQTSDWLWEMDENQKYTYLSDKYYRLTGDPINAVIGKTSVELGRIYESEEAFADVERAMANQMPFRDVVSMRKGQGGRDWWTQSSGTPMFDKEGRFLGYRGISRDVTEMKQLEGQLRQAQKMEAIGHLTGGIAHDFNNLLGIMKGNLELLRRHAPLDERGTNYLAEGLDAVARAAALTHRLLAFASRQPLQPRPSDIGDIIGGMEDLLRRTISENIDLEIILDTSAGSVLIDPRQLENAVLNLALNARDAMLKGGRLRIETSVGILDGTGLNLDANTGSGPCQVISVSDTGTGMPDELLQQAFDPFFTTKPFGRGSGLGLSMVHGFVRQSGGQVTMESRIGAGTVVRLYLPLILPLARTVAVAGMSIEDISPMRDGQIGQGRTVLIVEDDTELRNVAVEVMTDLDFIVLQAGDAEAARAVFESGVSVDLLFADVVLPGPINGLELVDLAREKNSGVMVLLCSGYAWETFETDKGDESGIDFISKPYGINELALAVEQVLVDG